MSAFDQAFVKAYARRQLANSKPGPHFTNDDGVVVAPSAADTASVWIDQAGEANLRVDASHVVSSQPVLPKSLMSKSTESLMSRSTESAKSVAEVDAVEANDDGHDAVVAKPIVTKPIVTEAIVTEAISASSVTQEAHVHTAYAIIEGDSSWLSILESGCETPVLIQPVVVEDLGTSKPDASEPELVLNRIDPVAKAVDAPHLSKLAQKDIPIAELSEPAAALLASPTRETEASTSTHVLAAKQTKTVFRASWEIDALDVPPVVADLFFDSGLFQQVAEQLADAAATGLRKVLVTSVHGGEGRSTIAIGLAIAAAASGQRVALVDGDTTSPTLVDDLRLDLEFGWIEALRGRIPLEEICVHATQDAVTFVPLLTPHGANAATAEETRMLIDSLESSFDLIIVDGGSSDCEATEGSSGQYDSAMIVFDQTRTARADVNEYSYRLRLSGIAGVGVVENFVG